jgi:hypothetical protein
MERIPTNPKTDKLIFFNIDLLAVFMLIYFDK